ncbi:MAG: ABC transporter permease, partial [Deltaproteobacteria bacterium]|nr:ABC transporter permease [Deltaproteobacteria bacterium]
YVVMASSLAGGLLLIIGNLLADILLAWVDPRISYR